MNCFLILLAPNCKAHKAAGHNKGIECRSFAVQGLHLKLERKAIKYILASGPGF